MEIETISKAETLQAITTSEIDQQIKTAKAHPRVLSEVMGKIDTMATFDQEVAESCFYALPRGGKTITGMSVRFAEIIASCWGNLRAGARIIGNDGKMITAQGIVHDLESNVAVTVEVQRKITDRYGKTYSEDMQIVTANAACSIAFRNAIYKAIPASLFKKTTKRIKEVSIGDASDMESARENALLHFDSLKVRREDVFRALGVKGKSDIDREKLFVLAGLKNAIADGETTISDVFGKGIGSSKIAQTLEKEGDKIAEAVEPKAEAQEGQATLDIG